MNIYDLNNDCMGEICSHLSDRDFIQFTMTCQKGKTQTKFKRLIKAYGIDTIESFQHKFLFTVLSWHNSTYSDNVKTIPDCINTLELFLNSYLNHIELKSLPHIHNIIIRPASTKITKNTQITRTIVLNNDLSGLPPNLQTIIMYNICLNARLNVPNKLTKFKIDASSFDQPLTFLPNTLKELIIKSSDFNQPLPNFPQLEKLVIESPVYSKPLKDLPMTLKKFKIISYLNPMLKRGLGNENILLKPNVLEKLDVIYNYPLSNLPNTLKKLSFSCNYLCSLPPLPDSLEILHLPDRVGMHSVTCNALKEISTDDKMLFIRQYDVLANYSELEKIIFRNDMPVRYGNGINYHNLSSKLPEYCKYNISSIAEDISRILEDTPNIKQLVFHLQDSTMEIQINQKNIQKIIANNNVVYDEDVIIKNKNATNMFLQTTLLGLLIVGLIAGYKSLTS